MKKTFTLAAIAVLLTSALFAQKDHHRDNNYDNNRGRDMAVDNNRDRNGHRNERGTYYFSAIERDRAISSINREYYRKIESVKNKLFMGRLKKQELIYSLEMERKSEIRSVIAKYNDRRNRFDRRDYRYDENDRRNKW